MSIIANIQSLGSRSEEIIKQPKMSPHKIAAKLGLLKEAKNRFVCPSSKDLWEVQGDKIVRLSAEVVDNGESLEPAPKEKPETFLASLLDELDF
jgi:hypothetical protein